MLGICRAVSLYNAAQTLNKHDASVEHPRVF
jgi:hypothetical protein